MLSGVVLYMFFDGTGVGRGVLLFVGPTMCTIGVVWCEVQKKVNARLRTITRFLSTVINYLCTCFVRYR